MRTAILALVALLAFIAIGLLGSNNSDPAPEPPAAATEGFVPLEPLPYTGEETPFLFPATDRLPDSVYTGFVRVTNRSHQGAGFIVRPGIVLTNAHVLIDRDGDVQRGPIRVQLPNKRSKRATLIGYSATYDLAVLQIAEDYGTPLNRNWFDIRRGQTVLAVGNPSNSTWYMDGPVVDDHYTILHQHIDDHSGQSIDVFLFDAQVQHGYSGGPVLHPVTGSVYGMTVGYFHTYTDDETGEEVTPNEPVSIAMHINDLLVETDEIIRDARR